MKEIPVLFLKAFTKARVEEVAAKIAVMCPTHEHALVETECYIQGLFRPFARWEHTMETSMEDRHLIVTYSSGLTFQN